MNHLTQTIETNDQMNGEDNPFSKFGEVIDLHPVYTAMERAREAAEANGTEPADVVWDPAWPDLPIDNDDYWNDLVERNWETLSRWYAMSLAAARKGKVLHFKVRDGVETVTEIETAPASTASEMVPEPMRAIIPPLDRIGPQQAASAATTPRTFPTAAPQELTDLRLKLHGNGYHPVPVIGAHIKDKAAGKRPTMTAWQTKCLTLTRSRVGRGHSATTPTPAFSAARSSASISTCLMKRFPQGWPQERGSYSVIPGCVGSAVRRKCCCCIV
jgi:hypothetical protein